MLNYHMKLHYSQTALFAFRIHAGLNYHMKLHYSQTILHINVKLLTLNYHMKLHYSQTAHPRRFFHLQA